MIVLMGERCPYCTKHRSPRDIIHYPGNVKICVDCERRHQEALDALSTGTFNGTCSECGKSARELGVHNLEMAVHYEGGRYRLLCKACDLAYVPKRKELYGNTEFAKTRGL